jgi:hypothetical protein
MESWENMLTAGLVVPFQWTLFPTNLLRRLGPPTWNVNGAPVLAVL